MHTLISVFSSFSRHFSSATAVSERDLIGSTSYNLKESPLIGHRLLGDSVHSEDDCKAQIPGTVIAVSQATAKYVEGPTLTT